ncbi:MAG TPA: carboxypeptidase-like regulatory domain-containing protein [Bacteroidales bacterium]|nr:carboxypeptidase-like regulatory domain-containing protein [Bacteroidales bacterium]
MNRYIYIILVFGACALPLSGQEDETRKYVQVSGIITDVLYHPVPGVSVISRKLRRATVSEPTGIYSITSTPGDTIFFRAVGFKRYHTIIPLDYSEKTAEADIVLETDTIEIEAVTILPWKNYSEFLRDMTKERPADPLIENMNDNITSIYVAIANESGVKISPDAGFRYVMDQNFNAISRKNQTPYNNLLNPFAWSKFFSGLKNGLLKNETPVKQPRPAKVRKKKNSR